MMNNASFILRRAITEPTTVSPPLLLQKKRQFTWSTQLIILNYSIKGNSKNKLWPVMYLFSIYIHILNLLGHFISTCWEADKNPTMSCFQPQMKYFLRQIFFKTLCSHPKSKPLSGRPPRWRKRQNHAKFLKLFAMLVQHWKNLNKWMLISHEYS